MASKVGRSEGLRRPVIEVAGPARKPNRGGAEGTQERGEVAHEQAQRGETARYGCVVRRERGNREDSGRRNANACAGGGLEARGRLSRSGNLPPRFLTAT